MPRMLRLAVSFAIGFTLMWGLLGTQYVFAKRKGEPIACWQIKAAIALTGSEDAAEKYALTHGYTAEQIATARRKCLRPNPAS